MKKIVTIVGARPQFIKANILSKELEKYFNEVMIHTGQHYDVNMSEIFFSELCMKKPKYNLGVGSDTHAKQTAEMMIQLEKIILEEQPDAVLLYGDTNSTLAGALVAGKLLIPIIHVEGGIRIGNRDFPEEQNRILSDHLSELIFVGTKDSLESAIFEGLKERSHMVGDIMYDSLLYYTNQVANKNSKEMFNKLVPIFAKKNYFEKYYLLTLHRPQNTDNIENLEKVLNTANTLDFPVIFAVHPRVKNKIISLEKEYKNVYFVNPLSYFEVLYFTKNALKVITDSGGLHKEAYLHGTPCVTLLESGWKETNHGGWNHFVDIQNNEDNLLELILDKDINWNHPRQEFGDGKACQHIVEILLKYFKEK